MNKQNYFVHESAYVDTPCNIGADSQIWHFSHLMSEVVLGEKCKIGQNVFIASGVTVGNNVKIQNNVSIYAGVILEDDVFCGPSCVFTNINTPRSAIPRNTIDDYLLTRVKQGATIGANATIVCGHTIGKYAFIGAGATVTKDIPDYALVYGNPAEQHGWMCECGVKLPESIDGEIACVECDRQYQLAEQRLTRYFATNNIEIEDRGRLD